MNEEYNEALEWAANWITGAQMLGRGKEVEKFAHDMAMSIRAAKRPTPRAVDAATPCPYCKRVHDNRLACPEYAAFTPHH